MLGAHLKQQNYQEKHKKGWKNDTPQTTKKEICLQYES